MSTIISILAPLFLGAIGWFLLEFFGRPVRNFFDLRREIKRRVLVSSDFPELSAIEPAERPLAYQKMQEPITAFAELGAQLVAFEKSEWIAAWFIKKIGFDPIGAGKILREISILFAADRESRDRNYRRLDHALKFRYNTKTLFYNPYNP